MHTFVYIEKAQTNPKVQQHGHRITHKNQSYFYIQEIKHNEQLEIEIENNSLLKRKKERGREKGRQSDLGIKLTKHIQDYMLKTTTCR